MQLAFYRASAGDWLDAAINALSGFGGFSHVEIAFSDGVCFSSSPRDGGTRFKRIDLSDGKWVLADTYSTPEQETDARQYAAKLAGASYDWSGVLHFVPVVGAVFKPDDSDWFCSEVAVDILQTVGLFPRVFEAWDFAPNRLAKWYGARA